MLTIQSTGSIASLVNSMRDVHGRLVPYAAATALTRTARIAAREDLPAEMQRVFKNPRSYTLNSLFVQPASKGNLSARVMVKTKAQGTSPEHYLFPEVAGGARNPKGFEQALRLSGLLKPGERVVPALRLPEAQFESGAFIRKTLRQVEASANKGARTGVFAGAVGRKGTRGIWRDDGVPGRRRVQLLFLFVNKAPSYRARLNFQNVVEQAAQREFPPQFNQALNALVAKGWKA